jgi:hypothetical protein
VTGLIEVSEGRQAGKWAREISGQAWPRGLRAAQEDGEEEDLDEEDLDDEDDEEDDGPVRTASGEAGVTAPR